jgi:hypothetical protein
MVNTSCTNSGPPAGGWYLLCFDTTAWALLPPFAGGKWTFEICIPHFKAGSRVCAPACPPGCSLNDCMVWTTATRSPLSYWHQKKMRYWEVQPALISYLNTSYLKSSSWTEHCIKWHLFSFSVYHLNRFSFIWRLMRILILLIFIKSMYNHKQILFHQELSSCPNSVSGLIFKISILFNEIFFELGRRRSSKI